MGRKRKSDEAAPAPSGASGTATAKPAAKKPATATNNVVVATGPGATAKDSGMVAVTTTGSATAAGPTGKAAGGKKVRQTLVVNRNMVLLLTFIFSYQQQIEYQIL